MQRSLIATLVAAAALAAPAVAQATTYTVAAGGGACGGADTSCGTLADAATAAASGDTVQVTPGTYAGATFGTGGVTIVGSTAGSGVTVSGGLSFTATSGGTDALRHVTVVRTSGAAGAIDVTGSAGLVLSDALVVGLGGPGVGFSAGSANKVERSTVITGAAASSALRVTSADTSSAAKALTVDSTIVAGGAAGVAAVTGGTLPIGSTAGDVTLTLRHVTAAASTHGVTLDASGAHGLTTGVGNIAATATDSIVLNGWTTQFYTGIAGLGANTATIGFTRTRQGTDADAPSLFVNPARLNFHLRAGSPAIGQGGFTAGESTTDVDGDPRPGPVTDQGADEFVNHAPTARLSASPTTVAAGKAVTFSAAASSDPDGPLAGYAWSFGDGTTATSTSPTIAHTYTTPGTKTAVVVVFDTLGLTSAPSAPVTVTVTRALSAGPGPVDRTPPSVRIRRPRRNQVLRLHTRSGRRARITFSGTAADSSGVRRVTLALRLVSRARTARASCLWLDPRRGFRRRSCSRPIRFTARLRNGRWTYAIRGARHLVAGTYRLYATGTDRAGVFGNSHTPANVRFRLR